MDEAEIDQTNLLKNQNLMKNTDDQEQKKTEIKKYISLKV